MKTYSLGTKEMHTVNSNITEPLSLIIGIIYLYNLAFLCMFGILFYPDTPQLGSLDSPPLWALFLPLPSGAPFSNLHAYHEKGDALSEALIIKDIWRIDIIVMAPIYLALISLILWPPLQLLILIYPLHKKRSTRDAQFWNNPHPLLHLLSLWPR
jgi:hypothetical protein